MGILPKFHLANITSLILEMLCFSDSDKLSDDDPQPKGPKVIRMGSSDEDGSFNDSGNSDEDDSRLVLLCSDDADMCGVPCYRKGPFYLENKSLPVFEWNVHAYKVHEIVHTLLDTSLSPNNVCVFTPTNVEHNYCIFLVNQSKLKCAANLRADDSGLWENNGVRRVIVAVRQGNVSIVARDKEVKAATMVHGQCHLTRTYFIYHACPDFRKIIFTLCGKPISCQVYHVNI